jgi:hypothetical protein
VRYGLVLWESHRYAGWSSCHKQVEMAGPPEALVSRMRPWALEVIRSERLDDGEYYVQLVRLDDEHGFVTNDVLEAEDVFWFYGEEYVPASAAGSAASSALV